MQPVLKPLETEGVTDVGGTKRIPLLRVTWTGCQMWLPDGRAGWTWTISSSPRHLPSVWSCVMSAIQRGRMRNRQSFGTSDYRATQIRGRWWYSSGGFWGIYLSVGVRNVLNICLTPNIYCIQSKWHILSPLSQLLHSTNGASIGRQCEFRGQVCVCVCTCVSLGISNHI